VNLTLYSVDNLRTLPTMAQSSECKEDKKESRAVARQPRDAASVLSGLKFVDNIHYKFKSSQSSKTRLQSSKHTD